MSEHDGLREALEATEKAIRDCRQHAVQCCGDTNLIDAIQDSVTKVRAALAADAPEQAWDILQCAAALSQPATEKQPEKCTCVMTDYGSGPLIESRGCEVHERADSERTSAPMTKDQERARKVLKGLVDIHGKRIGFHTTYPDLFLTDIIDYFAEEFAEIRREAAPAPAAEAGTFDAPEQAVCKNCGRPLSEHRGDGRCPVLPIGALSQPATEKQKEVMPMNFRDNLTIPEAGPLSVAETLKIPLEGLPAEWKRLENYYQQLSDAAHPGYDQGSFQGKAIGYGNCAAILKDRLAAETPTWFQDLNQKLKLFAQEHGIPFPYNETLEGRVMAVLEVLEERVRRETFVEARNFYDNNKDNPKQFEYWVENVIRALAKEAPEKTSR